MEASGFRVLVNGLCVKGLDVGFCFRVWVLGLGFWVWVWGFGFMGSGLMV